jgi:hypothetical protein
MVSDAHVPQIGGWTLAIGLNSAIKKGSAAALPFR